MKKDKKEDVAKVRVFFGEIEGDNQTIRDGLRSIAEAVNRTFQQETRIIKVIGATGNIDPKQISADLDSALLSDDAIEIEALEKEDLASDDAQKKNKVRTSKKAPTYSIVKELNLRPDGITHLLQFFNDKKPDGQQQQLIVVLHYLIEVLKVEKVSVNHVYTGLKDLSEQGVRVPLDIPQAFRNMANRKGWVDSSNALDLKITTAGSNFVVHDLPKTKNSDE